MSDCNLSTEDNRNNRPGHSDRNQYIVTLKHTIPDLFEHQARLRSDNVALYQNDKELSYDELDAAANRIAWTLIARGIGPEDVVALKLPRGFDLIAAMLGVLKAGACYVPLDPSLPKERVEFILADATPRAAISVTADSRGLPSGTILLDDPIVQRDLAARPAISPTDKERTVQLTPDNAAYVIYTSGSTGQPKGVVIEHRQVVRLFAAAQRDFDFGPDDCWTLFHSYGFDFSVWEIWGALFYGGRLVIVSQDEARSIPDFVRLLHDQAVTILNLTPTVFFALDQDFAEKHQSLPGSLHTVILGGEDLDSRRLEGWYQRHGTDGPSIVNMYGITETCVHVTHCSLDSTNARDGPSGQIGEALLDLDVYVLDEMLKPCDESQIGALYVAGPGLARGYLGRASLSALRFIANPFGKPGERLYRTGDLCAWTDGGLVYHGREDDQVKLRGHRVEIGEIAMRLRTHPDVLDATALIRLEPHGDQSICAFVTAARSASDLSGAALESYCGLFLPSYMVPSRVFVLESFPLTPNGKLDRG
ncbi:MAG: amino acid adenylation domain-containing protein, partial [Pseudomonadota bacterium]